MSENNFSPDSSSPVVAVEPAPAETPSVSARGDETKWNKAHQALNLTAAEAHNILRHDPRPPGVIALGVVSAAVLGKKAYSSGSEFIKKRVERSRD